MILNLDHCSPSIKYVKGVLENGKLEIYYAGREYHISNLQTLENMINEANYIIAQGGWASPIGDGDLLEEILI